MGGARAVRLTRTGAERPPAVRDAVAVRLPGERRANTGASTRAARLTIIYVAGIAIVYVALVALSRATTTGSTPGATVDLAFALGLAALLAGVGAVLALGAAPRAVVVGAEETVVLGRFGGRHVFPGRGALTVVVHQRFAAGWLSPTAVASVELLGGARRRSFMLDEGLLDGVANPGSETRSRD